MAFKRPGTHSSVPESPDRLFRDLPRRKHASLYDHQGQVLRTYTSQALNAPDVALQLPTGSGKTLVGLLLAEWRRRKFRERVVYLCPTRQLVTQVAEEASSKYGLSVEVFTGQVKSYSPESRAAYVGAERVAITTYNSLFNSNPFFEDPEIIVIDDAHAAEQYIASQWTVRINRHETADKILFKAVAGVLKPVLPDISYARLTGSAQNIDDVTWVDKLPTHQLLTIVGELRTAVGENIQGHKQRFSWTAIADHLHACHLYVSSSEILIRPLIPPTWTHAPFAGATQRIFMSATLGAGGDLERLTGRFPITRLAIPEGWDRQGIGRRFFLFPEKSLNEKDLLELRRSLMKTAGRSLVLTPSNALADEIREDVEQSLACPVFNASDLEVRKADFTGTEPAVAIVANRYDGIDLPDDDCRLLFVEGLPRAANLQERFLMNRMGAALLLNERVQTRVLQAVGRCTRGLNDYSAVVITGEDLPAYLTDRKRRRFLHPELQAELEFGIEQSTNVDAQTMLDNFRIFLEHDAEWEEANDSILEIRNNVDRTDFPAMTELASVVSHELGWQEALWNQDFVMAYEEAREVLGGLTAPELRGYRALWHYLAGSAAEMGARQGEDGFENHARLQYANAKQAAAGIPWLVALARGVPTTSSAAERVEAAIMQQVELVESYLVKLGTLHNRAFSAREREIREGLAGGQSFERAQVLLGEHLGFSAGKRETDASPDPWWIVGDIAFVFEDHANARDSAVIDATKARQAASHPNWLRESVAGADKAIVHPVLITPATKAKRGALPHLGKVWLWELDHFRQWAEQALVVVRTLRRNFVDPGDLAWRSQAAEALVNARIDAPGLASWLSRRPAREHLEAVP